MFRGSEKFWAFVVLILAILVMASLSSVMSLPIGGPLTPEGMQTNIALLNAKIRILDAAVVGLIGIAGMAAQSLFKRSQAEDDTAEAMKNLSQKTPPVTGEAREVLAEAKAEAKAEEVDTTTEEVRENDPGFGYKHDPWNK